jgi:8-oxo-dGTP pyrophosphatase MutT (NUDIX family)
MRQGATAQRPVLTRDEIRSRLTATAPAGPRGDVATAMHLMSAGELTPYEKGYMGAVPTTGISYDRAPGTPGSAGALTPAAVLVPLVQHLDGFTVLLTQRTDSLSSHAGQISFPGGRLEENDADAVAGALRETEEETGIAPSQVEILGRLDAYVTITGYEVTPIVGAITPPMNLMPDPIEVADIFEVPLDFFLNPENHQRVKRDANGQTRAYYAMPFGDRYIWGATAGMLVNLYEVVASIGR